MGLETSEQPPPDEGHEASGGKAPAEGRTAQASVDAPEGPAARDTPAGADARQPAPRPSIVGATSLATRVTRSTPRLILASASPRRQSLLAGAGYSFVVHPSNVDESTLANLLPADLALQLAVAKADAVAAAFPGDVVLAADTVVAFGDSPLGKPADADEARRMLCLLSGTTHVVVTGVAVVHLAAGHHAVSRVMSAARMRPLTPQEIERYVASNDWQGKAGGYGIQDNDPFVTRLTGCHTNIVGLPMTTTRRLLVQAGVEPVRGKES